MRAPDRRRALDGDALALAFGAACFALAGHPQLTVYALAFAARPAVRRAYLARVRYAPGAPEHVAMCLVGESSDEALDEVQKIFWALFPTDQHLDILFITADEEARLAATCASFYEAREPHDTGS